MPDVTQKPIEQIKKSIVAGESPVSLIHALRTTVAAGNAYLIAKGL
jgi:hypothetical protein